MRFILPGNVNAQIHKMLRKSRACLALFAAADALKLGLVGGVPPCVCVQRVRGMAPPSGDWTTSGVKCC